MMKNEINIREIVRLLKSKWLVIFSVITIFTFTGGLIGFLLPPTYEAKTDLLINYTSKNNENTVLQTSDIEMSLRLIETYKNMLKSDRMVGKVNAQLAEPYSKLELTKNISIESKNNSQIITIIAQEKTEEKAVALVNTYANTFEEEVKTLMSLENITILNEASMNAGTRDVTLPFYLLSVVSFIIGTIVVILTILVQEFYSTKLNTSLRTEAILNLPSLGTIPLIKSKKRKHQNPNQWDEKLVSMMDSPILLTEEFRRIRANLYFQMMQKNAKTILVTSPINGDGKSLISINLALIMAMDGKKTVYVDADLRKPIGRQMFNLPKRNGLTSIVSGNLKIDEVIQKTGTENLSFISAGPIPPNPAEVLSSVKMKAVIEILKDQYDVIIIDTPSLVVADAISLSTVVDGCIYVIDAERTKEVQASKSLEQLQKVEASLLGTILNKRSSTRREVRFN